MFDLLRVNDVIKYIDDTYLRIVWIEKDGSSCYVIELFLNKIEINYIEIKELLQDIINKECEVVEKDFLIVKNDNELTKAQNKLLDRAINIVDEIFKSEPYCYNSKFRRSIILKVAQEYEVNEKTVYKYYRKYLQGGKVKYALLDNYNNCGGRGKSKKSNDSKRGRPSFVSKITNKRVGINVDGNTKKIFKTAINRYYKSTKERSLPTVYRLMLNDFFSYKDESTDIIMIKKHEEIPSFGQFKYWFYKERENESILRSRMGDKKFDLNHRKLKSDSIYETIGPGVRYQIDATIGDVYLVSRIDRKSVIGRPVVYLIIDVFSRMITGVSVSLEGPSWNGASTAIYNCMENKVEYCRRYGIDIGIDDWNVKGLPQIIIGDRGEMVGPIAEKVISNLKISIENTPSYMGCAKGIVEQYFHVINTEIKHWLPGEVKKGFRERGERDYRKDAKLDIVQFTKIILLSVIKRNKTILKDYPLSKEMIDDDVKPIPVEIWNWGLKNKTGNLRSVSNKVLQLNLLKTGRATIQREGIKFKGLLYSCPIAESENWFLNAQIKGVRTIEIRYDDRNISNIYLIINSNDYIKAELILEKTYNGLFFNKTYEELEDYNFNKSITFIEHTDEINNLNLNLDLEIQKIVNEAEEQANISNNKLTEIMDNRRIENEEYRKSQAIIEWNCNEEMLSKDFDNTDLDNSKNDEVSNNLLNKLKKIKEKQLNDL